MRVDRSSPDVRRLVAEVQEINEFLLDHGFNLDEPPAFRRIFNNGDQAGFNWDQGGRLYTIGPDSYQFKRGQERRRITIDEIATVELDIRSSQLTIAYGLAGEALPKGDLYDVGGFPRDIVKAIITSYLGKGDRPTQWPRDFGKEYSANQGRPISRDYKLSAVVDEVLKKHPILGRLTELGLSVMRLQYVESEVILSAMLKLIRTYQIPTLPVFDCLIVRKDHEELAASVLKSTFSEHVGISPVLKRTVSEP